MLGLVLACSNGIPNLMRVYRNIVELFDVENIVTLKSELQVTQGH